MKVFLFGALPHVNFSPGSVFYPTTKLSPPVTKDKKYRESVRNCREKERKTKLKKKVRINHHPGSKSIEPNLVNLFLQQKLFHTGPLNEINNLTRQMLTEERVRKEMEDV